VSGRSAIRWICLDVGETLIEETRIWSAWADVVGIPRMTFLAAFGAIVERGQEYRHVFELFGITDWRDRIPAVDAIVGDLDARDLYPDAVPSIAGLRARGYRVAVVGNQPTRRHAELRAMGIEPDVMAMSEELGASKPDPGFFERMLEVLGRPDPASVVYVGDRRDNDVLAAAAAGLRPVWLRRGPWGRIPLDIPAEAALVVDSLTELIERVDEAWGDVLVATGSPAPAITRA
jgi:HAD superfamily hydrolase (TIGR01662 family)